MSGNKDRLGFMMIGYALGTWTTTDRWVGWFFFVVGLILVFAEALDP